MSEQELQERIMRALYYAKKGSNDGADHKMWCIDQMVRALTGCPMVKRESLDWQGQPYTYMAQGESESYREWVAEFCMGEDGPETYSWEVGIAP